MAVAAVRANLGTVASMLRQRYGVTRVVLFGSYARGDVRPDSDVDLLVDGLSGKDYFAAMADVSRLLKRDVDLVRAMDASPLLLERIKQQGVLVDG